MIKEIKIFWAAESVCERSQWSVGSPAPEMVGSFLRRGRALLATTDRVAERQEPLCGTKGYKTWALLFLTCLQNLHWPFFLLKEYHCSFCYSKTWLFGFKSLPVILGELISVAGLNKPTSKEWLAGVLSLGCFYSLCCSSASLLQLGREPS